MGRRRVGDSIIHDYFYLLIHRDSDVAGVLEIRLFTITFFFSFTATQTATWIGPLCRIGPTGARAAPARTHTRTHAHTRMSREAFDGEAGRVQRHGHNAFKQQNWK